MLVLREKGPESIGAWLSCGMQLLKVAGSNDQTLVYVLYLVASRQFQNLLSNEVHDHFLLR
jgi:hypothetical protein